MGILEQTLTQELGAQLGKLNRLDKDIATINSGLAVAALGADGGKASIDRLERLEWERPALQATVDALRTEIAAAIKKERRY
jgi:uncharacterized protein (UPF0335 family)